MTLTPLRTVALSLVTLGVISAGAAGSQTGLTAKVRQGNVSAESAGSVVIDATVLAPLRSEPLASLEAVRDHYRRHEELAAADEIDKSVSWLRLASASTLPARREKLLRAARELAGVAEALRAGDLASTIRMDPALEHAAAALADFHYLKGREVWQHADDVNAEHHLEMAASYLEHAANSARYDVGPEAQDVFSAIRDRLRGKTTVDHQTLGTELASIEKALKDLEKPLAPTS